MAAKVCEMLTERGHKPADLFDVYDFMWLTLRPSSKDALAVLDEAAAAGKLGRPLARQRWSGATESA